MSDLADTFNAMREESQARRAENREGGAAVLRGEAIPFITKNAGAHLIVDAGGWGKVNFWPGTGLWVSRSNQHRGRGVRSLVRLVRATGVQHRESGDHARCMRSHAS